MPEKEWVIHLDDGFEIRIRRDMLRGRLLSFAVVLIRFDGQTSECISRYDTAHGFAHKDILGKKSGLFRKASYATFVFDEIFDHALRDFKKGYREEALFYDTH